MNDDLKDANSAIRVKNASLGELSVKFNWYQIFFKT